MSFPYLYILQRQWIWDINNFFNSAKTFCPHVFSPVRAVSFVLPTQPLQLRLIFAKLSTHVSVANLASCV